MSKDPLAGSLRDWGAAVTGRHAPAPERPGSHPLDKARSFAPGTRAIAARELASRDGRSRRFLMGAQLEKCGFTVIPKWSTDPVTCTETRTAGPIAPAASVDAGIPPDLRALDKAIAALTRQNIITGTVVRIEYTARCSQEEKAAMVSAALKSTITLRQYRTHLATGRQLLRGKVML